MSRRTALVISLLLALAASAGAYAVLSTAALRSAASKPQVASSRDLVRRAKQLDAWAASLAKAERSRPPALPAVPRYAPVPTPRAAALGILPAVSRQSATAVVRVARTTHVTAAAPRAAPATPVPAPPPAAPASAVAASPPPADPAATAASQHPDDGHDGGTDD